MQSDFHYVDGDPTPAFLDELHAYLRKEVMPHREHLLLYSTGDAW